MPPELLAELGEDPIDQLLRILEGRGVKVVLGDDQRPSLQGPKEAIRDEKLLGCLRLYRDELIERLKPPPTVECLWPSGLIGEHAFPENGYPVGAGWYRQKGGPRWRPIPGRVNEHGWYHWRGAQSPLQPRGEPGLNGACTVAGNGVGPRGSAEP